MTLPDPVVYAIPFFFALTLLEALWLARRDQSRWSARDASSSIALGIGSFVVGLLTAGIVLAAATWLHQWRLFTVGYQWYWFGACFLLDDLLYYVFHRSAHRVRWFWASHVVHHSSEHYNLATALRQTWTGFFSLAFAFRLPLVVIGFPPAMVFFVAGLNLIYQFWIHTEVIGRMPHWFEAVMNTPSHHRAHHATNPRYLDRNYAGVLIVWDRLFGTFEPECRNDPPRYGIVHQLSLFNPFRAATHEWIGLIHDVRRAPLRAKLGYVLREPGWSHDGSRETSETMRKRWQAETSSKANAQHPDQGEL